MINFSFAWYGSSDIPWPRNHHRDSELLSIYTQPSPRYQSQCHVPPSHCGSSGANQGYGKVFDISNGWVLGDPQCLFLAVPVSHARPPSSMIKTAGVGTWDPSPKCYHHNPFLFLFLFFWKSIHTPLRDPLRASPFSVF